MFWMEIGQQQLEGNFIIGAKGCGLLFGSKDIYCKIREIYF